MLTISDINNAMSLRAAMGYGPDDSLCDHNWSAAEWNARQTSRREPEVRYPDYPHLRVSYDPDGVVIVRSIVPPTLQFWDGGDWSLVGKVYTDAAEAVALLKRLRVMHDSGR